MDNYIITLPPPCTNSDLHMGHLTGVYILGDIYARYQALNGSNVTTICGADQNNTYTEKKAELIQIKFEDAGELYASKILNSLNLADVKCDTYVRTSLAEHVETVKEIVNILMSNGTLIEKDVEQIYCASCNEFICDTRIGGICANCGYGCDGGICENCSTPVFNLKLLQPSHKTCSTASTLKTTKALVLNLSKVKNQLVGLIEASSWDNRLKCKYLEYLSREEFEEIIVSCNYNKGIKVTADSGNIYSIAIWFEAIWSLFTGLTSVYKKNLTEIIRFLNETNSNIVVFMGQDTEFYYALTVSAILLGLGANSIIHKMSIQRFIKLSGKKFSSSRGHTIFLEELIKKYHIDVIRLYSIAVIEPYFANNSDFSIDDLDILNLKVNTFKNKLLDFKVGFTEGSHLHELIQLQKQLNHYKIAMANLDYTQVFKIVSNVIDQIIAINVLELSSLDLAIIFFMLKPIMPTLVDEISAKLHFLHWETLNVGIPKE